jgi:hypothetical protein
MRRAKRSNSESEFERFAAKLFTELKSFQTASKTAKNDAKFFLVPFVDKLKKLCQTPTRC